MTKFNLVKEKITVHKSALMQAINTGKEFAITYKGELVYAPYTPEDIFIFKGTLMIDTPAFAIAKEQGLKTLFGNLYKLTEEKDVVIFEAENAWGEIVGFNQENASYDDTTSDGIMDLGDKELEEMSWHATEFGITNRDISDVIEQECEGTLFCIHKEKPFMFSSLIFIDDFTCAREKVRTYIKEKISDEIANNKEFSRENLTDDEAEAARYFEVI